MASDVTAGIERLTDQPVAVDPDAIEAEFTRIWQDTAAPGVDQSAIRLRVLNFVGIGLSLAASERFEAVMEVLPHRHPCRGIMATSYPDETEIRASISAHCWRSQSGGREVCSEEILLYAPAGQEQALASAVLALLVPELPVTAWLIGDIDLQHETAAEIIDAAERVFIDSAGAVDPRAIMRSAVHAHESHEIEVCDLAWCRLTGWRGLVAQFFDSAEGRRELDRLRSIEIISGGERPGTEALLLAGWLVSRLGLSLADTTDIPHGIASMLYRGSAGIAINVIGSGGSAPALEQVRLRTQSAEFSVELHPESGHIHVREEWPGAPVRRTVEQLPSDDASLFAEALDDSNDPRIFLAALRSTLVLLGEAEATENRGSRA